MSQNRIYFPNSLELNSVLELPSEISHKLIKVIRSKIGDSILMFDGGNKEATCIITEVNKKTVVVRVDNVYDKNKESNINIHLYQSIAKSDKMDFIIQKATELGAVSITPIISERTVVKLKSDKIDSKMEHWQKVAISACEQSGRNFVPKVNNPIKLSNISFDKKSISVTLDPTANSTIKKLPKNSNYSVFIGPEGGFSDAEVKLLKTLGSQRISLGPRILRAETAALTTIAALQLEFGDLS